MQKGDLVTATWMPELGIGVIEWLAPNGRPVVTFEIDGKQYVDEFDPFELEPAKPTVTRTA